MTLMAVALVAEELVPPHDLVAEQSVLGAMMKSADAVWEAFAVLEPGDFYQPRHETIYRAIKALSDQQKPVDMISVTDELQRVGLLQKAGDAPYLAELTNAILTTVTVTYYAGIVRDHAIRRQVIIEAERMLHYAYRGEGDAQEILEAGRTGLDRVVRASVVSVENIAASFDRVVTGLEHRPKATATPWPRLDAMIVGLIPGKLYVVGARPGEGKSMMGLQFARALCVSGNVAFSSLEMAEDELTERLIASMAEVDYTQLEKHSLTQSEWERIGMARPRIQLMPLYVDDRANVTITQIKSHARSVARKGSLGGVVVDYLQLVSDTSTGKKRYEVLGEITRQLKIMANELDCPVILLSQLNREAAGVGKMRRAPSLADLRESGSIEQDADVVLLLQRVLEEEDKRPGTQLDVFVAKNRSGKTGLVRLRWEGRFARIVSPAPMLYDAPVQD